MSKVCVAYICGIGAAVITAVLIFLMDLEDEEREQAKGKEG